MNLEMVPEIFVVKGSTSRLSRERAALGRDRWCGGLMAGRFTGVILCCGLSALAPTNLLAQQDTVQKAQPETRRLEIPVTPSDSTSTAVQARLPKIDLPEYVITGDASINIPALQKESARDDSHDVDAASLLNPSLTRQRPTAHAALPVKETLGGQNGAMFNGTAYASLGSFFSPQAGIWYGKTLGEYDVALGGRYYRSKGFKPYAENSGGSLTARGGTTLKSNNPNFDQAELTAALEYNSDTYNWYGTRQPAVSRNRSNSTLSAGLSNWSPYSFPYTVNIALNSFQVSDSSANVNETTVHVAGSTRFTLSSASLDAGVRAQFGSISGGSSSAGLAFIDALVGSDRYRWKDFSLQGSLHAYLAHGMGEQRLLRLYPHLDVAYRLTDAHTLRGTYEPEIVPSSLSSAVQSQRYISAFSRIKHLDDQYDGALSLESEWSAQWSTKFEARIQSLVNEPLYADSSSQGIWQLAYGGRTTMTTFRAGVFAKLPANDYFSSQFVVTISQNSVTGDNVPYVPGLAIECRYVREILEHVRGMATLTLIHVRKDNVVRIGTMPSFLLMGLRGEYQVLQQARIFVELQNLLNQTYEYWKGYQESPLMISAGVTIRW